MARRMGEGLSTDDERRLPEDPPGFRWVRHESTVTLVCLSLQPFTHGWTSRSLDPAAGDDRRTSGWAQLALLGGVDRDAVVRLRQVHGSVVIQATTAREDSTPVGDGLVSCDPRHLLTVGVADCVPLLIVDRRSGAVAAVHAGWRGTAAGIAQRAVERLVQSFGSRPADIRAAIGPSIGPCCYEVGSEPRESFRSHGWPDATLDSWFEMGASLRLNLWAANRDQLVRVGVPREAVALPGLCTACQPTLFHSFRRDGSRAGRMAGFIRAGMPQR